MTSSGLLLRLPPTSALEFLPGQYIEVIGAEGLRRSYSIANAPRADKQIELHIREVPDGAMSRYWFREAKLNDLLRLRGPLGTFFLRGQAGKHLVLLATGTGIAPVKAILEGLSAMPADAQPRSVTVYWGCRGPEDHYWQPPELPGLAVLRFVPGAVPRRRKLDRRARPRAGRDVARSHLPCRHTRLRLRLGRDDPWSPGQIARCRPAGPTVPFRRFRVFGRDLTVDSSLIYRTLPIQ